MEEFVRRQRRDAEQLAVAFCATPFDDMLIRRRAETPEPGRRARDSYYPNLSFRHHFLRVGTLPMAIFIFLEMPCHRHINHSPGLSSPFIITGGLPSSLPGN